MSLLKAKTPGRVWVPISLLCFLLNEHLHLEPIQNWKGEETAGHIVDGLVELISLCHSSYLNMVSLISPLKMSPDCSYIGALPSQSPSLSLSLSPLSISLTTLFSPLWICNSFLSKSHTAIHEFHSRNLIHKRVKATTWVSLAVLQFQAPQTLKPNSSWVKKAPLSLDLIIPEEQ